MKFGGAPEQYKEFVAKRSDKTFWEIIREYCTENKMECKK